MIEGLIESNQKVEIIYTKNNIQNKIKKNIRNYGIDLARIISIFFIVSLHLIYQGGPLFYTKKLSFEHKAHLILKIIYSSGVNLFGMISGCIGYTHKYSNLFYHLITSFFYNIIIAIIFKYFFPGLIKDIRIYLYPFNHYYWYFKEYFKMFFFLNLINKGVISMNFKSMKNFVFILFLIFSCLGIIKNFSQRLLPKDIFSLKNGFSYNWLIILYCYGSFLGKFKITKKKFYILRKIFLFLFSTYLQYKINVITINNKKYGKIFDIIDYTNPFQVLISFSVIILFSNMNIKSKLFLKFISFFAPLTFGIYLIHCHNLFLLNIISKNFIWILNYKNIFKIFLLETSSSLVIFLFCSLIDFIREHVFKFFKLKKLCIFIENYIQKLSEKIFKFDFI